MKYLSPEQVLFIHSRLIDATGGIHGVRDLELLQSALSRPKATFEGKDLHPDLFHKAVALMEALARNHPFIDGNKRTAITSAGIFLAMNGFKLECSSKELERFTIAVSTGSAPFEYAVGWFKRYSGKTPKNRG